MEIEQVGLYNRSRLFLLTQQPEVRLLDQMRTILPRPGPSQPALYPSVHQPKFNYSELGRAIPAAPIHTVAFPALGILHKSDSSPEMSRRNQISRNLKGQLEKIRHQGTQMLIHLRPWFFIVIVDPCCLLVAFHTEGALSHPHFAYEAETRQLTRSEPGCECYVLHSVNRLRYLMLLRVGCACGVRHCLHITRQPETIYEPGSQHLDNVPRACLTIPSRP